MEDKVKAGEIVNGTDDSKNFKYSNVAVYCSKCDKFHEITDPNFQNIQTGLFLTANAESKWSFGCGNCGTVISLVFIEKDEPQIEDAVIEEEVKEVKDEVDSKE